MKTIRRPSKSFLLFRLDEEIAGEREGGAQNEELIHARLDHRLPKMLGGRRNIQHSVEAALHDFHGACPTA